MPGELEHTGGLDLVEVIENAGLMGAEPLMRFLVLDVARVAGEVNPRVTRHQNCNLIGQTK
jgi:hypothetical protein